jgi:transglutaminase-like putative cysteine protease
MNPKNVLQMVMKKSLGHFFPSPFSCLFLIICLVSLVSFKFLRAGEETYSYNLLFNGKKAGYHTVTFNYREKEIFVEATTFYRIKAGGKTREFSFEEKGLYGVRGEPRIYNLNLTVDDSTSSVKLTMVGDSAFIDVIVEEKIKKSALYTPKPVYLLDNNMLDHYTILFRQIDFSKLKEGLILNVVTPQILRVQTLELTSSIRDTLLGREVYKVSGRLGEAPVVIYVDAAMKYLVKLELPAQNFEAISSTEAELLPEKPAEISDLFIGNLFLRASRKIESPNKVAYLKLKGRVEFATVGQGVSYIQNRMQKFIGSEAPEFAEGVFEIVANECCKGDSVLFPHDFSKRVSPEYLSSEFMIPSEDSSIIKKALQLSSSAKYSWDVVRNFNLFVKDSIRYETFAGNALETLLHGGGNSTSKALLLIALCRAVGIPARLIGGLVYFDRAFVQHNWAEVFVSDSLQWVPVDPTLGEDRFFNATHISLWIGYGSLTPGQAEGVIEIIDYKVKK